MPARILMVASLGLRWSSPTSLMAKKQKPRRRRGLRMITPF